MKSKEFEALYSIIDTIDASIFWKDLDGRYLGCNKYMVKMSGFKDRSQIIGKKDKDMPWHKIADSLDNIDRSVLKKGIFEGEETPLTASLKKQVFHTKKTVLYNNHHEAIGIVGVSIDITKRKRAENLLKKNQTLLLEEKNKAEAANLAKTEFLANMRHDIRTPLSGIVGFAEILKSESQENNIKEYASNLIASSHALLDLMDEVLEAVRVSSGEIPKLKKKFDLKELVNKVIDLHKAKACEKKLKLNFLYDPKLPRYIIGDKIRLYRIALELISNALNFTHTGQVTLAIELAKKEQRQLIIKLQVIDSGIGIPKDKQQEIYLQFKRLTPSYQGLYKGTGLGLYIVKQFIDELEAEIYVNSNLGEGTTFSCIIPLQEPLLDDNSGVQEDSTEEKVFLTSPLISRAENKKQNTKTEKILVVEDNIIAQKVASMLLNTMNCDVDLACSGQEAIQQIKNNHYDLIFMDIGLGDGDDGYEVTKKIRKLEKENEHTPIVALTAHAAEENKELCIEAGMDAVLLKPITKKHAWQILTTYVKKLDNIESEKANKARLDLPDTENELFELDQYPLLEIEQTLKNLGNKDIFIELLDNLINKDLQADFLKMKEAFANDNYEEVEKLAHKIKGGAVYVGTTRMKYACQYLERYWKTGQRSLFSKLFTQAVDVIEKTEIHVKDWLKNQINLQTK